MRTCSGGHDWMVSGPDRVCVACGKGETRPAFRDQVALVSMHQQRQLARNHRPEVTYYRRRQAPKTTP